MGPNLVIPNSTQFFDHPYAPKSLSVGLLSQCFQISSTTSDLNFTSDSNRQQFINNGYIDNNFNNSNGSGYLNLSSKYKSHKNHIMEKYLRSFDEPNNNNEALENNNSNGSNVGSDTNKKPELSKW